MRAADQGLRRHLEARHRQLPPDRNARDPARAGGRVPLRQGIDAVASARAAALVDPDGEALARCLAELDQHNALAIAAE